jgi:hypothetical protein
VLEEKMVLNYNRAVEEADMVLEAGERVGSGSCGLL